MSDENLFPADMEEMTIEEEEMEELEEQDDYIGAAAFDSDFVRDGQNCVRGASGIDSWKQWCINCLTTEREASPSILPTSASPSPKYCRRRQRKKRKVCSKQKRKRRLPQTPTNARNM